MKQRKAKPTSTTGYAPNVTPISEVLCENNVSDTKANQSLDRSISRAKIWMHSYTRQYPKRAVGLVLCTIMLHVILIQIYAMVFEKQGPLDHIPTATMKLFYERHCPAFSTAQDINQNVKMDNSFAKHKNAIKWSCLSATRYNPQFPRMVMIGARTKEENNTYPKWRDIIWNSVDTSTFLEGSRPHNLPRFERINTLVVSNEYAVNGGLRKRQETMNITTDVVSKNQHMCRSMKWEHRLFAVYQTVFGNLLSSYPGEEDFVIVEDDAILVDTEALVQEICQARLHKMQFYSLYRSPLQQGRSSVSCIYQHGTVAFYIRRPMMEKVMNENRRRWFCRFPIDMYISRSGPWYATRREIVGHLNGRRVGSGSKG